MSTETENSSSCADMPPPVKEHEWLQKFVGEWKTEAEFQMDPAQPSMKATGTESTRAIGGFWIVGHGTGEMPGMPPYSSVLTLGFDPKKQKYIGSWIDSMTGLFWKYEGEVDTTGRILKLKTEGLMPGNSEPTQFEEVTEFIDDDHRVFTSTSIADDGTRKTLITIHFYRQK